MDQSCLYIHLFAGAAFYVEKTLTADIDVSDLPITDLGVIVAAPEEEEEEEGYTESDVKDALEQAFDSLESNEYRSWGDVLVPFGKLGRVMGPADETVRIEFLSYYFELINAEADSDKALNMGYVGEILLTHGGSVHDALFNSPYWRTS